MSHSRSAQRGAVLVEAALVFLFLSVMLYSAFALSMKIKDHMYAQNLAGAGGQIIYRQCAFVIRDINLTNITQLTNCINDARAVLQGFGAVVGRDVEVLVSMYADPDWLNPDDYVYSPSSAVTLYETTGTANSTTFGVGALTAGGFVQEVIELSGVVIIVEVYVENQFSMFGFGGGWSYEYTIS